MFPLSKHEFLASFVQKGATQCHFNKNQIVLYGSHFPIGIFIMISGDILICLASHNSNMVNVKLIRCNEKMLILPSIRYLDHKSQIQAKALSKCEALFIPKLIFHNENSFNELLSETHFCASVDDHPHTILQGKTKAFKQ